MFWPFACRVQKKESGVREGMKKIDADVQKKRKFIHGKKAAILFTNCQLHGLLSTLYLN